MHEINEYRTKSVEAGESVTQAMEALLEGFQHHREQTDEIPFLSRAKHPAMKTGKRASQSEMDLWRRHKSHPSEDRFLPAGNRAARRAAEQEAARRQRRGQRAWNRRQHELGLA